MDSVLLVAAVVGVLFSFLAALAAGYVWVKRAGETATIEIQDRRITALTGRVSDLENENGNLRGEVQRLSAAVTQVQGIDKVQETVDSIKLDTSAIRAKVAP